MYFFNSDLLSNLLVRWLRRGLLLVICLLLAACQSGDDADPMVVGETAADPATPTVTGAPADDTTDEAAPADPTTPAIPTDTPAPTPSPTPELVTVVQIDGTSSQQPPLPPADYYELLQDGVEQGEWSEGEGIIRLLRLVTGEISSEAVPGATAVAQPRAGGLVRHAVDYVADDGHDAAVRAEIEQLLARLAPDQETLDAISRPADAGNSQAQLVLAGTAAQSGSDPCVDLAANGFDDPMAAGEVCYVYDEASAEGNIYRVYYPQQWQGDTDKKRLTDAVLVALVDSGVTYNALGRMEDVNAVFSLLPHDKFDAAQRPFPLDEPCPVTLYPSASADTLDVFKQIVAHEVFHCVQDWNFTTHPYETHKWWMEGSAEYFSNVVYPTVNAEHGSLNRFDIHSRNTSLLELTYENFIFFQYLGNQLGNAELMNLMEVVSAGGADATTLAGYSNMDVLFQQFVVDYLSVGIPDTGGGVIQVERPALTRLESISEEGTQSFDVSAFVAARFGLAYEAEKRFLQEGEGKGNGRHSTARREDRRNPAAWSDLPPEIRSYCDDRVIYGLAVTTVEPTFTFDAEISLVEEAECDPCLLGTWRLLPDSFAAFLQQLMQEQGAAEGLPAGMSFEIQVAGDNLVQFLENGELLTRRDDFRIIIITDGNPPLQTSVYSTGSGAYTADGQLLTGRDFVEITDEVTVTMGGNLISATAAPDSVTYSLFGYTHTEPGMGFDTDGPRTASVDYVCRDDTMTMFMPDDVSFEFERVEQILPTPVPTPAP
jgi:hypothetical protein